MNLSRLTPRTTRGAARWLIGALAVAGLCAPAAAQRGESPLPPAVAEALAKAQVPEDALAAVVMPLGRWGTAWQRQAQRPMQPGSVIKVATSIVALDQLGPNHRGFTELLTRAPQQGDVLAGDVVLRGGADAEFGLPQLWAMLAELRQVHGIREIAGDIVIDRGLFRPLRPELGVPPFDEQPEFAYNVIPDALQLNGSLMGLEISSEGVTGQALGPITARTLPPLPGLVIDASAMRLTERACKDWDDDWISPPQITEPEPGTLRVALQGGFPKGCTVRPSLQLIDRSALAERQLRALWLGLGGTWTGRVREADAPLIAPLGKAAVAAAVNAAQPPLLPGAATVTPGVARGGHPQATPAGVRVLASHTARPWGELLRQLNKQSDNVYSRLLYLSLGLPGMADEPGASTAALADRAVRRWLAERKIDAAGLVVDNGSGMSRSERISPRTLALMLKASQQSRWAPELMMSLPVVGVDGTMRNRLKASPAGGQARLKTGTLKNVAALAGFVPDAQGRQHAFVAMINHDRALAARPALDALVDWVARGGLNRQGAPVGQAP